MVDPAKWAIVFGILILASWLVGGLMTIFGPQSDARHRTTGPFTSTLVLGLNISWLISIIAMIAILFGV
jgi:hypothetical protein